MKWICLIVILLLLPSITAYRWEQRIDLNMVEHQITDTSFNPTEPNTIGLAEVNLSAYDNIKEIYFETVADYDFNGIPNGIGFCIARLYDATNDTGIDESQHYVSLTPDTLRSGNITYLFNNSKNGQVVNVMAQIRVDENCVCRIYHATLVIVQGGDITKTRTMIPVGASYSTGTLCLGGRYFEMQKPKRWNWDADKFQDGINVSYHSTFKSTSSGKTAVSALIGNANRAILSTTTSTFGYYKSATIAVASDEMQSTSVCRSGFGFPAWNSFMRNGFIVVDQVGIDPSNPKTVSILQTDVEVRTTSVNNPVTTNEQRVVYNTTNFKNVNLVPKVECDLLNTAGGTAFCNMYIGNDIINDSNVTVLNSSYTWNESKVILDEWQLLEWAGVKSGIFDNTSGGQMSASNTRLIFYINGLRCWDYNEHDKLLDVPNGCRLSIKSGEQFFV